MFFRVVLIFGVWCVLGVVAAACTVPDGENVDSDFQTGAYGNDGGIQYGDSVEEVCEKNPSLCGGTTGGGDTGPVTTTGGTGSAGDDDDTDSTDNADDTGGNETGGAADPGTLSTTWRSIAFVEDGAPDARVWADVAGLAVTATALTATDTAEGYAWLAQGIPFENYAVEVELAAQPLKSGDGVRVALCGVGRSFTAGLSVGANQRANATALAIESGTSGVPSTAAPKTAGQVAGFRATRDGRTVRLELFGESIAAGPIYRLEYADEEPRSCKGEPFGIAIRRVSGSTGPAVGALRFLVRAADLTAAGTP